MLGLGETDDEVIDTIKDIYNTRCRILTIGQYLQPSVNNYPVLKYIEPAHFNKLKDIALEVGFEFVESGPFVRSSYHAEKHII